MSAGDVRAPLHDFQEAVFPPLCPWRGLCVDPGRDRVPTGSCMVPQTIDAIVESPHPAPHIVLETIPPTFSPASSPSISRAPPILTASPRCHCRLEFDGLSVQEQDSTVTLEARCSSTTTPQRSLDADRVLRADRGQFRQRHADRQAAAHLRVRRRGRRNREQRAARGGSRHRRDHGFDPASTTLPIGR